tara:strand:+ start:1215 stop:1481 length:267 start_codon:yes stop_codon:yes gene_type:complete
MPTLRFENRPIKRVLNGAVKRVQLLNGLSDSCCVGFDAVDQSLSMTLGRFLLFFVVGLVLAIAFPQLSWLIWPLAVSAAVVVVRLIRR